VFGQVFKFHEVFPEEISVINQRRPDGTITLEEEGKDILGDPIWRPTKQSAVIGLALSGGGVRSAAFCLGTLQGLHLADVLKRIDYLSTVSGGGYIGASLSAGMSTYRKFPFETSLTQDETPSIQHIRDYSNYLFPNGPGDLLRNSAIYARGLLANVVMLLSFLLIAAAVTILSNPTEAELSNPDIFGFKGLPNAFGVFTITWILAILFLAVIFLWAIYRSSISATHPGETDKITWIGWIAFLLVVAAFCEMQPFVLRGMFEPESGWAKVSEFVRKAATWLAPFGAVVGFLSPKIGEFLKSATESPRLRQQLMAWLGKAGLLVASAVVPLILWAAYLQLSYWGIRPSSGASPWFGYGRSPAPEWLHWVAQWLPWVAQRAFGWANPDLLSGQSGVWVGWAASPIAWLYLVTGIVLVVVTLILLQPNANSLHPLYRDRLSKAFLFKPTSGFTSPPQKDLNENYSTKFDLEGNAVKLSELSPNFAPYHILNTALNIQDSKVSNRRGRNADFFAFSRNFIGSQATGYVKTADLEEIAPGLDLATAMAASGAAFSSNMGAATIKLLAPTLALLNIRTGYWLRNPLWVAKVRSSRFFKRHSVWANYYFIFEMFGLLSERRKSVYITDGGHIENLGIYELLRRRCEVIIAVDAEADSQMSFGSFVTLQRYARIDLGVRIELPWEKVKEITLKAGQEINRGEYMPRLGPHCIIGEIQYPQKRFGILIYIKASLTGDENDYIRYYGQRHAKFPHETTLDQFFSEEQFEVYRALGFHAAYGFFDRKDEFAYLDPPKKYPRVREQLKRLDDLFPQSSDPAARAPDQRHTFSEWLSTAAAKPGPKPPETSAYVMR
jgi:hypothetical protein